MEFQLIGTGDSTQPVQVQQPLKKPRIVPPKSFDLSCIISVGAVDIDIALLQSVQSFIEKECISGLCSIERGGALQRLHFQAVFRIVSSSSIAVSKLLKTYLGWDKKGGSHNSHVLMKNLTRVGLHTYIGMIGYYMKDRGEEHFQVVHNNVTDAELDAGLEEYVKYGTPFAKKKLFLPPKIYWRDVVVMLSTR